MPSILQLYVDTAPGTVPPRAVPRTEYVYVPAARRLSCCCTGHRTQVLACAGPLSLHSVVESGWFVVKLSVIVRRTWFAARGTVALTTGAVGGTAGVGVAWVMAPAEGETALGEGA